MNQDEIELEITKYMWELQRTTRDSEKVGAPYMDVVEKNLKQYEESVKPYREKSMEIQEKIKSLVFTRAKSLKTGAGNITYRKGGIRRKWDLDGLDEVCDEYTDIKNIIWNLRKEEKFEPQVLIKINTDGISYTEI